MPWRSDKARGPAGQVASGCPLGWRRRERGLPARACPPEGERTFWRRGGRRRAESGVVRQEPATLVSLLGGRLLGLGLLCGLLLLAFFSPALGLFSSLLLGRLLGLLLLGLCRPSSLGLLLGGLLGLFSSAVLAAFFSSAFLSAFFSSPLVGLFSSPSCRLLLVGLLSAFCSSAFLTGFFSAAFLDGLLLGGL